MLTPMMIMMNNGEKEKEYHDENQDNQIYPHRSLFQCDHFVVMRKSVGGKKIEQKYQQW